MLKGAKAMTEVRKPGGHGEVASVLSVFQFKPQRCVINALPKLLSVTPRT